MQQDWYVQQEQDIQPCQDMQQEPGMQLGPEGEIAFPRMQAGQNGMNLDRLFTGYGFFVEEDITYIHTEEQIE